MGVERRSREARRRELLPRLYRVLSDYGLEAAHLRLLARETGTSARMLHYYFGSAEGLLHAVIQYEREQQREQLEAMVRGSEGADAGGASVGSARGAPGVPAAPPQAAPPDGRDPASYATGLIVHYFDLVTEPARRGFMVLFFEVQARAARQPERFGAFLEHATDDWVSYMQDAAAGITGKAVSRGAVEAVLALARGGYLALLSGSPRDEVRAWVSKGVEVLIREAFGGTVFDGSGSG